MLLGIFETRELPGMLEVWNIHRGLFLQVRLLLVHGTLSAYRLSRLIKYSFYKNIVFGFVLFFYQFYNGFSGQAMVDGISAAVYNVVFTSLPILLFAVFDRPVVCSLDSPATFDSCIYLRRPHATLCLSNAHHTGRDGNSHLCNHVGGSNSCMAGRWAPSGPLVCSDCWVKTESLPYLLHGSEEQPQRGLNAGCIVLRFQMAAGAAGHADALPADVQLQVVADDGDVLEERGRHGDHRRRHLLLHPLLQQHAARQKQRRRPVLARPHRLLCDDRHSHAGGAALCQSIPETSALARRVVV